MPTDLSGLAKRLVEYAAIAHSRSNGHGASETVLKLYREDSRAITAAVLKALVPHRKSARDVSLELPELGRVPISELIAAVEKVKVP